MGEIRFEHDGPSEGEMLMLALEDMRAPRLDEAAFLAQYGFPHHCTCADDVREGNTEVVPACYVGMTDRAMEKLVELRGVLYVIANSEATDSYALKALAHQAFFDTSA